ncbi:class I SAM-dependent methyltransferase [Halochromatium glycolicum]|uniref:class I SAM-dependent methyltransferase n=1 Tax=Halochromatium glycolicum TaxID=85075 RepID=UPI0030B85800
MSIATTEPDLNIAYYEAQADRFFAETAEVDMSALRARFLAYLAPGARILDAGCGSGRDARAFRELGYCVTAMEPSRRLATLAESCCGLRVERLRFQDIDWCQRFDGIWACASLLHVPMVELPNVLQRLSRALRSGGVLYASFKYGHGERDSGGRRFTDLDEAALSERLQWAPELTTIEIWVTADRRVGREAERWLNVLLANDVRELLRNTMDEAGAMKIKNGTEV